MCWPLGGLIAVPPFVIDPTRPARRRFTLKDVTLEQKWFSDPVATLPDTSLGGDPRARRTLICFSHLRWAFVFQRPQHLMTRFAQHNRVIFWEEPQADVHSEIARLELKTCVQSGVVVATPVLPAGLDSAARDAAVRGLLDELLADSAEDLVRWYYTPMMLGFSRHLPAICTVYDCMDELANFRFAPPELLDRERELFALADVVFTGGYSLYEAKRLKHGNLHPFPSSVDRRHFAQARLATAEPADQAGLPRPRFGFYGVIDERMDLGLLATLAEARPDWSIVMVGPVVKIDRAELPDQANITYLGGKAYEELPAYLGGWDVALMPFAINESTRFISPTKTPEYLAGGKPVVSTPIVDVMRHYGDLAGVKIADTPEAFIAACDQALILARSGGAWLEVVDDALSALSWDETFRRMNDLVGATIVANQRRAAKTPIVSAAIRPASRQKPYDYLIVGAGYAGSVLAERLASQLGKRVRLIDRRPHIGGNAYDERDAAGVLMHRYGPHIFHTNSDDIVAYLSQFTEWRPYEHRVLASIAEGMVPMPINRTTLNVLYGLSLSTDEQAEAFLASRAEPVDKIRTSEDVVVSKVGRDLYERFFRGYTRKQWALDPSELDRSVTARVPTRTNTDDRYFTDSFQAMPAAGYTRMFENMLDHPGISIELGLDFREVRDELSYDRLIFTGPIDEYFDHRYGRLPYRSLRFRHETIDAEWFQPVGTVNYPDEATPYTRISEYKHMTGQVHTKTTVTYEFPEAEGDPYYPIPRPENQALYKRYEALALQSADVEFVGRLATYRYYNMDQVVGQALATFRRIAQRTTREAQPSQARSVAAVRPA
jgi:UDP-galactopyranose mutase